MEKVLEDLRLLKEFTEIVKELDTKASGNVRDVLVRNVIETRRV